MYNIPVPPLIIQNIVENSIKHARDGITSLAFRNGASSPVGYTPGDVVEAVIDMWPITWTVKKGSRPRVDVSSSNFPAYHVHPNVAGTWALIAETKVATQTIHFGGEHDSRIEIPVASL